MRRMSESGIRKKIKALASGVSARRGLGLSSKAGATLVVSDLLVRQIQKEINQGRHESSAQII